MNKQPQGIAPGIYYDLSAEVYHSDSAISSSGLKTLLKSPYKYWDSSPLNPDREPLDTPTLKNSRAFHTMLLEPEKFQEEFTIKPGCKSSTISGVVGAGDYQDMLNAVKAVKSDSSIAPLLTDGKPEVSIFWRDEKTGVMCRVRFDYLRPKVGFDYKTTTDVSMENIGYAIADYRYDLSAAMYIEGLRAAGMYDESHLGFVLLFQEKKRPYLCESIRVPEQLMQKGYHDFRRGLDIYKENIERYGVSKWHSGIGGVKNFDPSYMPYKYQKELTSLQEF